MKNIEDSRVFMQKSLTSVNPKIDKYGILLRPNPNSTVVEGKVEQNPRMIGLLGTVGDGTEMVYMLHCDFWGKGYMTEAMRAFVGEDGIFWALESKSSPLLTFESCKMNNLGAGILFY